MKIITYTKTYGIRQEIEKGKKRFFVICDGVKTSLHYAKADFAMKKAEGFCRACYQDFVRDMGEKIKIHFVFKQI